MKLIKKVTDLKKYDVIKCDCGRTWHIEVIDYVMDFDNKYVSYVIATNGEPRKPRDVCHSSFDFSMFTIYVLEPHEYAGYFL